MKASKLIIRLQHLIKTEGDLDVMLDTNAEGLQEIGEIDVDAEDTGIIIWSKDGEE